MKRFLRENGLGLAFGAPLGRLFGYKPTYEAQAPKAPTALGF